MKLAHAQLRTHSTRARPTTLAAVAVAASMPHTVSKVAGSAMPFSLPTHVFAPTGIPRPEPALLSALRSHCLRNLHRKCSEQLSGQEATVARQMASQVTSTCYRTINNPISLLFHRQAVFFQDQARTGVLRVQVHRAFSTIIHCFLSSTIATSVNTSSDAFPQELIRVLPSKLCIHTARIPGSLCDTVGNPDDFNSIG
ncbi:hypothetical protein EG328_007381 [Venturia inaequalis]|uniref:Uncharacterized protein n=1 Tax=Venturia inaequalis TaxID=5025 RepID=A0A8H3VJV5_VENIN|nr:hypothetical protein EG328_007381 [Venturia inaequalis]